MAGPLKKDHALKAETEIKKKNCECREIKIVPFSKCFYFFYSNLIWRSKSENLSYIFAFRNEMKEYKMDKKLTAASIELLKNHFYRR